MIPGFGHTIEGVGYVFSFDKLFEKRNRDIINQSAKLKRFSFFSGKDSFLFVFYRVISALFSRKKFVNNPKKPFFFGKRVIFSVFHSGWFQLTRGVKTRHPFLWDMVKSQIRIWRSQATVLKGSESNKINIDQVWLSSSSRQVLRKLVLMSTLRKVNGPVEFLSMEADSLRSIVISNIVLIQN